MSLKFVHTENQAVIAEVTASDTPGILRAIRNTENHWVVLQDDLDRVSLFSGVVPHPLVVDFEKHYSKLVVDEIVK